MGLDGMILTAFILGLPANEIVLPIALMGYLSQGVLSGTETLGEIASILTAYGWTAETAVCYILFSLMHWPCATTLMTIRRESGSLKWTAAAFLIPAAAGCAICMAVHALCALFLRMTEKKDQTPGCPTRKTAVTNW